MNRRSFIATLPAAAIASQVHPPPKPTAITHAGYNDFRPATDDEIADMTAVAKWHYGDGSAVITWIDLAKSEAGGQDSKGRFIIRENGDCERCPA